MKKEITIFILIWIAMIATSFWEAYSEGKNAWDKGKLGWKIKGKKYTWLTAYHFWLFYVTFPALLAIPLVLNPSIRLLGILISAYVSGIVIEDFFWFVVNPVFPLKDWNPKKVRWYPWVNLGIIKIPLNYIIGIGIAILSWWFLWS